MRRGFLPVRDSGLLHWASNAARLIAVNPQAWGLSPQQRAAFQAAYDAFALAMREVDVTVRTRLSVLRKDEARVALESAGRALNLQVRGSGVADDAMLLQLQLTIHKTKYRRIDRPQTRPLVSVRSVVGQTIKLQSRATDSIHTALPDDVAVMAVYHWVGATPPKDFERWAIAGQIARARLSVSVFAPPGTPVHFVARYLNRRGESGPWSEPTMTYAMGGVDMTRLQAA